MSNPNNPGYPDREETAGDAVLAAMYATEEDGLLIAVWADHIVEWLNGHGWVITRD